MLNETVRFTGHALSRLRQRKIPVALIDETIRHGRKTILIDRKATQYVLKNILGLRGVNLVVIQGFDGAILTSYTEKIPRKHY